MFGETRRGRFVLTRLDVSALYTRNCNDAGKRNVSDEEIFIEAKRIVFDVTVICGIVFWLESLKLHFTLELSI